MNRIPQADLEIIRSAKTALETETLAMHISRVAGKPVDALLSVVPESISLQISKRLNVSLEKACEWAMLTAGHKDFPILREDWMHKVAVALTGFWGGFGGTPSTLAELPVSTMLMLRSISCIAEKEGLNPRDRKTRLSCVSVLAMGADPENVDKDELSYWMTRRAMAELVTQAAEWTGRGAAPVLTKFIIEVGKKFGIAVSSKMAMQVAPVIGGACGAGINYVFIDHYQSVAHAHFAIERLCLKHGEAAVKAAYKSLPAAS